MKRTSEFRYRPNIDGLRGIAVLSVITFHTFPLTVRGGFVGVDVFFVISGFLISYQIFDALDRDRFSYLSFYARRARRILPSLILVLFSCFLFGWITLLPHEFRALGKHIAGGAAFISNLILSQETGYFNISSEHNPLLHLWSLGIEEQFYIVWPIFLVLLTRLRQRTFEMLLATVGISFAINLFFVFKNPIIAFYSPITRFWELSLGSVMASLELYHPHFLRHNFLKQRAWLGVLLIVLAVTCLDGDFTYPGVWALLPTLGTAIILLSQEDDWVNHFLLSNRVLIGIGLISYPLYLWHWPLLAFARVIGGSTSPGLRIKIITLAFLLATLTYLLLETRVRRLSATGNQWKFCSGLTLAVFFLGVLTYSFNGFAWRFGPKTREYSRQTEDWTGNLIASGQCRKEYGSDQEFCNVNDIRKPPTTVLIGDSHANQLYYGLNTMLEVRGENLANFGAASCPPLIGIEAVKKKTIVRHCSAIVQALNFALSTKSVNTVYLAGRWEIYLGDHDERWDLIFSDGNTPGKMTLDEHLSRTLDLLSRSGKKVVLFFDTPTLNIDINRCFRPFSEDRTCASDRDWVQKRQSSSRAQLRRVALKYPDVEIFDPSDLFCDEARCFWNEGESVISR